MRRSLLRLHVRPIRDLKSILNPLRRRPFRAGDQGRFELQWGILTGFCLRDRDAKESEVDRDN